MSIEQDIKEIKMQLAEITRAMGIQQSLSLPVEEIHFWAKKKARQIIDRNIDKKKVKSIK